MTLIPDDTPVEGLGHFFDTIWRNEAGFVYLPTLDRKAGGDGWKKTMYKWPEHRKHVINHVLHAASQGLDAYYSPVIYTEPKPVKENVKGSFVVWADYDGFAPKEWTPETGEGPSEPIPPPTLRIQSSNEGNEHVYWQLDEFNTDTEWVENTNRSITYSTRADLTGWNINKVLRPPYTINYKPEYDKPAVTIAYQTENHYAPTRFAQLKPPMQIVSDSIDTANLPAVEGIIAKYPWDEDSFRMFMAPKQEEGNRSAALMRLGYVCAEIGLTDVELYTIVENADARWGKYVGRNDRKERLLDIVRRARAKVPTPLTDLTFTGLMAVEQVDQDIQYVYSLQDFLDSSIEVEWAIEDFLEIGGFGMIASAPGVGKTQISIQLGMACALGESFLGWQPARPMRITLVSLEMSHVALKKFMQTITQHYTPEQLKLLDENFTVIPLGEALPIDKELSRNFLFDLMDQSKPDGVIIDSLAKLTMSSLDEEVVKLIMYHLNTMRRKFGCFVWLIHHNRKPSETNKQPDSLSDIYGSVYITAEMTAVLLLYRKRDEKQIAVINVKNRLHEERPIFHVTRDENLFFTQVSSDSTAPVGGGLLAGFENVTKEDTHDNNTGGYDEGPANFKL
jgi:archaellum biogenesis ATPase FlaH